MSLLSLNILISIIIISICKGNKIYTYIWKNTDNFKTKNFEKNNFEKNILCKLFIFIHIMYFIGKIL